MIWFFRKMKKFNQNLKSIFIIIDIDKNKVWWGDAIENKRIRGKNYIGAYKSRLKK